MRFRPHARGIMESIDEKEPWLSFYPDWVSRDLKTQPATAIEDFIKSTRSREDDPAVCYFDRSISHKEINRLLDALAVAFRDFGLVSGDRIILDIQNVPQFLVAVYAAWKLGLMVVPVNPMCNEQELLYFCQDSDVKLFLTQDDIAAPLGLSFLKETKVELILITSPLDTLPAEMPFPEMLAEVKRAPLPDASISSGFKVWPRDVENVLYQHPAVREAAVVGIAAPYRGEPVKALVGLNRGRGHSVTAEKIMSFCKSRMAAYKCPGQAEFVAEIPKTLAGNFLRRTLRDKENP